MTSEQERVRNEKQKEEMALEHWTPPEEMMWQPTPKQPRQLKIPKVKEPPQQKTRFHTPQIFIKFQNSLKYRWRWLQNRLGILKGKTKVVPIASKIQARHLELEPLCCISSCLVRDGCMCVVFFELMYVLITGIIIVSRMSKGGFTLWEPIPKTISDFIDHHTFLYTVAAYDVLLLFVALFLFHGLHAFHKIPLRIHYFFCFFSLIVNIIFFGFSLYVLLKRPVAFGDVVLSLSFGLNAVLQIWATSVVKSCFDFFSLIHVFVTLAES